MAHRPLGVAGENDSIAPYQSPMVWLLGSVGELTQQTKGGFHADLCGSAAINDPTASCSPLGP